MSHHSGKPLLSEHQQALFVGDLTEMTAFPTRDGLPTVAMSGSRVWTRDLRSGLGRIATECVLFAFSLCREQSELIKQNSGRWGVDQMYQVVIALTCILFVKDYKP